MRSAHLPQRLRLRCLNVIAYNKEKKEGETGSLCEDRNLSFLDMSETKLMEKGVE